MSLTKYESDQVTDILKWKREEPSVVSKAFGVALAPITWLINKIIPEVAIRGVLDFSSSSAEWLTDTKDIVRAAGVNSVSEDVFTSHLISYPLSQRTYITPVSLLPILPLTLS